MASKKKSTKKKTSAKQKHYPTVRRFELGSVTETNTLRVLDVGRNLSVVNRRLYRMGRAYQCSISMDVGAGQTIEVYALRDDWALHAGLKMAYQAYLKNVEAERESLGKNVARWEDFRVYHGLSAENLVPALFDPTMATATLLTGGEFSLSTVVDSTNVLRTFTFGTPLANQYGVFQEYDKAGNAQASPSSPTGGQPYEEIDSEVNLLTSTNLQADGDNPPYDATGVNASSPWTRVATLGEGAGGSQRLSTGMFTAPCGLVVLVGNTNDWNSNKMLVEVKAGDYKGVHAPSMLE